MVRRDALGLGRRDRRSLCASRLNGKVVISMVNALVREGKELVPLYPPRGSMAAQLAFALPESPIVGCLSPPARK